MAALSTDNLSLAGTGEPEQLSGATVTANLLSVLSSRPALGREFAAGEDQASSPRVVLLSHGLWQRRFGADPPGTIGAGTLLLGVIALGAASIPAWRATRVDAATVLRQD